MKTVIILYELEQLASLDALIAKYRTGDEEPTIVSLDAEIDYALEKRDIPFTSGKTLQNRIAPTSYLRADKLTHELCESETLSSFQYRNILLTKTLYFSIQVYFINLLYYIECIANFVEKATDIEILVVPAPSTPVSETSSFLAEHGVFVVVEAVRKVAESRSIAFEMVQSTPVSVRVGNKLEKYFFTYKRMLFGVGLSLLNAVISLCPRREIRILASDYWRNISSVLNELSEAELTLLDRSEVFKVGFSNIWRHKMRFIHIEQFLSNRARKEALRYAQECREKWLSVRTEALTPIDCMFCGVSLAPLCELIITRLIERALPRVVCDISGTYAMYERLSPDAVLLRASVSEQIHFIILPLVAREVGIPALEMQHGGEYLGPGSATRRHAAYYLAEYGRLVCDEFSDLGYAQERLFAIGSPRFDTYVRNATKASVRQTRKNLTILSNTPTMGIGGRYGAYSFEEYFKALGDAVRKIPKAHLLIASRSASINSIFSEEARTRGLESVDYKNVGNAPLLGLFKQADIFVCSYSTVVYEALLCRLPIIIVSFAPVEKMATDFHFSRFQEAGALRIAHSPEELSDILRKLSSDPEARVSMSEAGWEFMQKNFSFDGHASERIAKLIRNWQRKELSAC